jgi:hypothetical protein
VSDLNPQAAAALEQLRAAATPVDGLTDDVGVAKARAALLVPIVGMVNRLLANEPPPPSVPAVPVSELRAFLGRHSCFSDLSRSLRDELKQLCDEYEPKKGG